MSTVLLVVTAGDLSCQDLSADQHRCQNTNSCGYLCFDKCWNKTGKEKNKKASLANGAGKTGHLPVQE